MARVGSLDPRKEHAFASQNYLAHRQNAITEEDPTRLNEMLGAIARHFGGNSLNRLGSNPVQILWARPDFMATNELLSLGDAILALEKVDSGWVKRLEVAAIKENDEGNRSGAIFELIALNMYRSAGHRVFPAKEDNPGYDGRLVLTNGSEAIISIKNHGISTHERSFNEECLSLDFHYRRWLASSSLSGAELRASLPDFRYPLIGLI